MRSASTAAAVAALVVLAAACAAAMPLTPERCTNPELLRTPGKAAGLPMQDLCSLCQQVMRNRYKWDWSRHPEALLTGTPNHVRAWGEHMACYASQKCQAFIFGSCMVERSDTTRPYAEADKQMTMTPCRPDILCYTCFPNIFTKQLVGCLDQTYWW